MATPQRPGDDVVCHAACIAWRHPRPQGVAGRCIGRTDVPLDRRKAKRLAHRIRQAARRAGWPRCIHTSPLRRCADVGRQLRRWGWRHVVDAGLLEVDFGRWDGLPWSRIPQGEVDAWVADFSGHAPGGGEPLTAVLQRAVNWRGRADVPVWLVVGHGGWMLSRRWALTHDAPPALAREWPAAPAYGEAWALSVADAPTASLARSSP